MSFLSNIHSFKTFIFVTLALMRFQYICNEKADELSDIKGKYPQFIYRLKNNKFKKIGSWNFYLGRNS